MFFTKYPHRANFSFAEAFDPTSGEVRAGRRTFAGEVVSHEGDVYHVRLASPEVWGENRCLEPLEVPPASDRNRLKADEAFGLTLLGKEGPLLSGQAGVSGEASMFVWDVPTGTRFYGMGQKTFGKVELSGWRARFWNTDVWGDFHFAQFAEHPTDPPYFSTPYVVARVGEEYVGFLLHNPYPAFMETPGTDESRVFVEWQRTAGQLILGTDGGEPNLWVIYGPTLAEVTRKLQRLVGVTPLPPLWALGYHQSRWGYGGHDDLMELDRQFNQHQIPCDSFWLDLDYMDGYRIFQTSEAMFPGGPEGTAEKLRESGRRIVPILDPGVKYEPGYRVYDDGHAKGLFCENVEGKEFVGMVWPGETVFPDFTMPEARDWWASYVQEFGESGFGATWVDMNDPSTGPVDPNGMRFRKGTEPHAAHHNQYALGMQMATREGLRRARPDERPFVLSRSGFIGSSRHAAIWTGDNISNRFYLGISIPTSIGMSLSGLPFNGPDLCGFGGDVTDELAIDWFKANFLFPFCRNHATKGTRKQEPYEFPKDVMTVLRRYIRLRYKLIPTLYNLFIDQEETGDPILRPLFYHFADPGLDAIDDQFLVGDSILQAPFLTEEKRRRVVLPGTERWYDAATGAWLDAGTHEVRRGKESTPLYVREGAILAMQPGTPVDNSKELRDVHLHVFIPADWSGDTELVYRADDGISFAYREGARSAIRVRLAAVEGNVAISVSPTADGFGAISPTFVFHGEPRSVRINGADVRLEKSRTTLTGKALDVWVGASS
jgi:alpha-glucosidase